MREYQKMLKGALSILGVLVIFGGVLWVPSEGVQLQILVVMVGVLALEAGMWGLTQRLVPNERRFFELREEGDYLITLVRELNAAAVATNESARGGGSQLQQVVSLMHECVELMGAVAGKTSPQHVEGARA